MTWTITKKELFFKWHTSEAAAKMFVQLLQLRVTALLLKMYILSEGGVPIWKANDYLLEIWSNSQVHSQLGNTFFCICPTSIFLSICKWISQCLFPFAILSLKHYFFKWLGKLYIHTSCCQVKLGIAWIKICIPFHVCCSMIKVKSWMAP